MSKTAKTHPTLDLSDADFEKLDALLTQTPEPLEPLDAVMLDGFLCGVLVQPRLIPNEEWLPYVFDVDGRAPEVAGQAWFHQATEMILRRHAALNRQIAEDGWFHPLVLEFAEDHPRQLPAEGEPDPLEGLSEVSQALMPWVAGFQHATLCFPDLNEQADDASMAALSRLYRHLPVETDDEREVVATLDREMPLSTLDDAVEDLVVAVSELYELSVKQRYKVETVRRETPKVGRNDPCPCASGKKYKQCHGAT